MSPGWFRCAAAPFTQMAPLPRDRLFTLANLTLPIGTHEVVFTHPQFGERKQTVVVKMDGLLRVTQTFQQDFKH